MIFASKYHILKLRERDARMRISSEIMKRVNYFISVYVNSLIANLKTDTVIITVPMKFQNVF